MRKNDLVRKKLFSEKKLCSDKSLSSENKLSGEKNLSIENKLSCEKSTQACDILPVPQEVARFLFLGADVIMVYAGSSCQENIAVTSQFCLKRM